MAELLLDDKSRIEVARFLQSKTRPHEIDPETWDKLLRAEHYSISFKDLRVLQKFHLNITRVFQYS